MACSSYCSISNDAAVVGDDAPDAAVNLFVLAGIAAADVICCSRLGVHATGESHNEAIALLKKAEPDMAKHLRAFTPVETAAYIAHRLRAASADPNSEQVGFDGSAIAEIFRFTLGVPRLINTACDNSLLLGFVRGLHQIDGPAVRRSIEDMTPNLADPTWAHNDLQPNTLSLTGT